MKLPLISRKKYEKLVEGFAEENLNSRILATKLKKIVDLCEDHNNQKIGNLKFVTIVKEVMEIQ